MNCICITAYKSPEMLSVLLEAIQEKFICFVHIDKKNYRLFSDVIRKYPEVHFYSDYSVGWGGIEHLEAIILLLKEALKYNWDYAHIISGEDYPICTDDEIYSRFASDNKSYVGYELVTSHNHPANKRYRYFWLYTKTGLNYKNKFVRLLSLSFIALQYIFVKRKHIGLEKNIYWGFIWGDYHREAIECIFNYISLHPEYMKSLKWCKIPEEFAFQTILANDSEQSKLLVNETLRFWNWSRGDNSGPPYLMMDDINDLRNSNAIFARKVKYNSEVLKAIKEIRNKSNE